MKAVARYTYGSPDVLEIVEHEKPTPSKDEILIKIRYSSVNRTDDGFLRAKPFVARFFSGLFKPRQPVLGCEFAGDVVELGSSVTDFRVGDRVFGFDDSGWGGHAEFKIIRSSKAVYTIPDSISYKTAAASAEGALYAYNYMKTVQKLGAHKVLIHGGTGAIGSAAIQLFVHEGFEVIATSPTKHIDTVKSLGATKVIDWQKTDFTQSGEMVDVVFDAVGKSVFSQSKKLLRPGGVYISSELGPHGQNPILAIISPLNKLLGRRRVLFPLPSIKKAIIIYISERLTDGSFSPLIDRMYLHEQIPDAFRYVESGEKIGNVSIKIDDSSESSRQT